MQVQKYTVYYNNMGQISRNRKPISRKSHHVTKNEYVTQTLIGFAWRETTFTIVDCFTLYKKVSIFNFKSTKSFQATYF